MSNRPQLNEPANNPYNADSSHDNVINGLWRHNALASTHTATPDSNAVIILYTPLELITGTSLHSCVTTIETIAAMPVNVLKSITVPGWAILTSSPPVWANNETDANNIRNVINKCFIIVFKLNILSFYTYIIEIIYIYIKITKSIIIILHFNYHITAYSIKYTITNVSGKLPDKITFDH